MDILGATLRVCVDDLETAVPFYERLAGGRAQRFERRVSVASWRAHWRLRRAAT